MRIQFAKTSPNLNSIDFYVAMSHRSGKELWLVFAIVNQLFMPVCLNTSFSECVNGHAVLFNNGCCGFYFNAFVCSLFKFWQLPWKFPKTSDIVPVRLAS